MERHDTVAHIVAGGFGVYVPDCAACRAIGQCEYIFSAKTVTTRCGLLLEHKGGHGNWRHPVTGEED